MTSNTPLHSSAWDDKVLPFQLDLADIRGRVTRLDGTLDAILKQHNYPPLIEALVAEMTLLTAMIGQSIKLRWKLSLQVRGSGPARLIATDYLAPQKEGEPARIRAYASFDAERLDETAEPFSQVGDGYFAILIHQGEDTTPYQGITPLGAGSLSACTETYFDQSEQLKTRFKLAAGRSKLASGAEGWRAGGVMLQQLPKASPHVQADDEKSVAADTEETLENWTRANALLDTVETLELIGPNVSLPDVLHRLFHEEEPRVYAAQDVEFGCTCSKERVEQSLSIYSQKDLQHMITDEGTITADCQFCGAHYVFDDPTKLGFEGDKPSGSSS